MYPLSRSSENFKKALQFCNKTAAENESSYVGSEHFVYAFLNMPECSAYGILTGDGITKNEYGELFFKTIAKDSPLEGLTERTKKMYDRAVLLAEETDTAPAGTIHMLYAILEVDCYAVKILRRFSDISNLLQKTKSAILALKNKKIFGDFKEEKPSGIDPLKDEYPSDIFQTNLEENQKIQNQYTILEKGNAFAKTRSVASEKLAAYGTDMTERARKGKIDPVIGRKKEIEKVIQVLSRRLKNNPVLVVSIHQNSYSSPEIKGAQTFYYPNKGQSRELARVIQERLVATLDTANRRKISANDSYYLLKNIFCPAVIVECGFLSNPQECENLETDYYQEKVAWAIYMGIMQHLNTK